jgi:hypothetical protein
VNDDDNVQVLDAPQITGALESITRGEIDIQIATAKRYPRDITVFMKKAETLATMNDDIAAACFYKVPRDGKKIEGPSVRFAEIIAATWGHMRIDARTVNEDERFVYAQGVAWDVQENVAIRFETRRRITNRRGERYNDDMIATTANAAAAIGLRNAVFRVIPKAFWEPIYERAKAVAIGTQETLGERRQKMLAYFVQKVGVTEDRLFAYLGVTGVDGITLQHVEDLRGLATALKDGDTKIDAVFGEPAPSEPLRRSEKAAAAPPTAPSEGSPTRDSTPPGPDATRPSPAAAPSGPGQLSKDVRISDMQYVGKPKDGVEPYYEIKGEEMVNGRPKIGRTWCTQDEQLARLAGSCEGSGALYTLTWHQAPLAGGTKPVAIVTAIAGA